MKKRRQILLDSTWLLKGWAKDKIFWLWHRAIMGHILYPPSEGSHWAVWRNRTVTFDMSIFSILSRSPVSMDFYVKMLSIKCCGYSGDILTVIVSCYCCKILTTIEYFVSLFVVILLLTSGSFPVTGVRVHTLFPTGLWMNVVTGLCVVKIITSSRWTSDYSLNKLFTLVK